MKNITEEETLSILKNAKIIAIVGLTDNEEKISYKIAKLLQQAGYKIIPVNPTVEIILGEKSYPSLLDIPEPIDIVNVFRRPDYVYEIAEQYLETNASLFWCQLGIINEEAFKLIDDNNRKVVMNTCIKVMYSKL